MRMKQFACILLLTFLCCSLLAVAADNDKAYVKGSGVTTYVPMWTGTKSIGDSGMLTDSTGDLTAGGSIFAYGYVYGVNGVYGSFGSFSTTYGGNGIFQPSTGRGVQSDAYDGTQPIEGGQEYNGFGWEFAFFDSNGTAVFYGDNAGDTVAIGGKSAAVPLKNGKMVKVYSQESPQVWFEDFGSGKLVGGVATVKLDSKYVQLVNTKLAYHVFLTPNGDCHGLYVNRKDRNSFEVRELGGGQSNVGFDYRISALRNGYEHVRLEPANAPSAGKAPQRPALPTR